MKLNRSSGEKNRTRSRSDACDDGEQRKQYHPDKTPRYRLAPEVLVESGGYHVHCGGRGHSRDCGKQRMSRLSVVREIRLLSPRQGQMTVECHEVCEDDEPQPDLYTHVILNRNPRQAARADEPDEQRAGNIVVGGLTIVGLHDGWMPERHNYLHDHETHHENAEDREW
jgi:hypothetical protein